MAHAAKIQVVVLNNKNLEKDEYSDENETPLFRILPKCGDSVRRVTWQKMPVQEENSQSTSFWVDPHNAQ